jgi:hypothetical protein
MAAASLAATALSAVAWTAPAQGQQPPPSVVFPPPRATGAPAGPALPPLSPDAQLLLDRWAQDRASIIEQLRFLQLTYRDAGRAEDAAAIAAHVRALQPRTAPASGTATTELVNEGLPNRDQPVLMSLFRNRVGETLSFAIRGRDDQQLWGTVIYTDTSALETAAVHAGVLRPGQSGIVKVRVLPGQDHYDAANQNGVQSSASDRQGGSFRLAAVSVTTPVRTSSLSSLRDLVGQDVTLPVVGAMSGDLWGSQVYTDDSSLAAAVVHSGVLAVGEFGFVKVTLMPGQAHYDGSAQYGITSQSYDAWEGSFRVERASEPWVVQLPGGEDASRLVTMAAMRGHTDTSFIVQVVGSPSGSVWGTGTYTDDSSIAAAAVHAGLLKPGEIGFVRVRVDGSHERYAASESNGVRSQSYGPWEGSFRLERIAK